MKREKSLLTGDGLRGSHNGLEETTTRDVAEASTPERVFAEFGLVAPSGEATQSATFVSRRHQYPRTRTNVINPIIRRHTVFLIVHVS